MRCHVAPGWAPGRRRSSHDIINVDSKQIGDSLTLTLTIPMTTMLVLIVVFVVLPWPVLSRAAGVRGTTSGSPDVQRHADARATFVHELLDVVALTCSGMCVHM
jgi:hypothetical protein